MPISHRKEIRKLAFRALALRWSESRNCGLFVVYIHCIDWKIRARCILRKDWLSWVPFLYPRLHHWVVYNNCYIEHKFLNQYDGPKPELYRRYIDDCVGATSSTREELNQFITAVNSFHPALKYTWEISDTSLAFLDINFPSKATVYAPVCTTNSQILIVICCIHLHIHHMSRILFLILRSLDFVAFVVRTLIFP